MPTEAKKALSSVGRLLFGLIFITTAIGKLLDNRGFADVLLQYRLFPGSVILPLALTISLGELCLGILLWRNRYLGRAAAVTLVINTGYLLLAAVTLARGISLNNCGCFGVFWARPLSYGTLIEDGVLVVLSVLFFLSAGKNSHQPS